MLKSLAVATLTALAPLAAAAQAQAPDLSGAWQITGEINAGAATAKAAPLCTLKQTGAQLSGGCEGPRAKGTATGLISGRHVAWQWHATSKAIIGVSGLTSFDGDLGADGVIRGTWTTTQLPGAKGTFSAQRR